jgi:hypothetical protein
MGLNPDLAYHLNPKTYDCAYYPTFYENVA